MLRELVSELQLTLQLLKGDAPARIDIRDGSIVVLKRKIVGLSHTIYDKTDEVHLKRLVGSVFESMSVEEVLIVLKAYNLERRSQKYRPKD
jgi:hypothetical protein